MNDSWSKSKGPWSAKFHMCGRGYYELGLALYVRWHGFSLTVTLFKFSFTLMLALPHAPLWMKKQLNNQEPKS